MKVMGIVGSPRKNHLTDQLVRSALSGAASVGVETEVMYLRDRNPQPCIHCGGSCFQTSECLQEEDATKRNEEISACDAIVLGAPVYIWQINGITAEFIDKFRLKDTESLSRSPNGRPALGISVAGGTGTGLISALQSIYKFFCLWGFRGIDPLPVTKYSFQSALKSAEASGRKLAEMTKEKKPFAHLGECLAYYDDLELLKYDTIDEIYYLSGLMEEGIKVGSTNKVEYSKLVENRKKAGKLIDSGRKKEASKYVMNALYAGMSAWELR